MNHFILVMLWGLPPLTLQWLFCLDLLLRQWRIWLLGTLIPTGYLIGVESLALGAELWQVDYSELSGLFIPLLNVPIERALPHLFISAFFSQTYLILSQWHSVSQRMRHLWRMASRRRLK